MALRHHRIDTNYRDGRNGTVWGDSMRGRFATLLSLSCLLTLTGFDNSPRPGQVLDEARVAGRDAASFPPADEDYFHDMDNAIALTPEEIKGRNMWLVWSGGHGPVLGRGTTPPHRAY